MIKLRHYTARLVISILLLQVLSLPAQSRTSSTPTALPTHLCDALRGTLGVHKRLDQYSDLVRGRNCIVLNADPTKDVATLINQIPENTVILLSSNTVPGVTPAATSSASPTTGKTSIKYLIGSEIVLKDGQDIIGAADDGFEITIALHSSYRRPYMVRVGATDNFHFEKTKDSHIRHITFLPSGAKDRRPVNATIFAECSNRKLIVEHNIFYLPNWAAVDLDCRRPLDASADPEERPGPGLRFANNIAIGDLIRMPDYEYVPEDGILINLPAIHNQPPRLAVIENTIKGKMADAGDFILGPGTSVNIFRNTVDISNMGVTLRDAHGLRKPRKGGFVLIGHTNTNTQRPLFNLAGNQIRVTGTAIIVLAQVELALACNHLRGLTPWQQPQQQFSLKAADHYTLIDKCPKLMSSPVYTSTPSPLSIMATTTPYSTSQIENTWTAIADSKATACTGLTNLEGHLFFNSEVCSKASVESSVMNVSTGPSPTSSAVKAMAVSGLGVIITVALLLAL